jgi:hypothetical protein
MNTELSQSTTTLPYDLSGLTDPQLLVLVALKRLPFDHETWKDSGVVAIKMALRNLNETLLLNSPTPETVHPALDKYIPNDRASIERLYKMCLRRLPNQTEIEKWGESSAVSTNALCDVLLYSYESYKIDALTEGADEQTFRRNRKVHISTELFDEFARHSRQPSRIGDTRRDQVAKRINARKYASVALNSFGISSSDLSFVSQRIFKNFGVEVVFRNTDVSNIINDNTLEDCDIFLTGNNNLYDRTDEQLGKILDASAITAVWLWDNHHQYDLSIRCSRAFDMIFPAHSNGHSYLYGGKALVGPLVPCCVVQWSYDEARLYFSQYSNSERQDDLYGKFNSYPGRNALRDQFLCEVNQNVSLEVKVISANENDWHHRSIEERFQELSRFKIILCNTIFNDVPARLFDALLVGAVPILPYGLADIGQCFPHSDSFELPLIQYAPNNLHSLQKATEVARQAFDDGGRIAAIKRHLNIAEKHMFRNRMERMVSEVLLSMDF